MVYDDDQHYNDCESDDEEKKGKENFVGYFDVRFWQIAPNGTYCSCLVCSMHATVRATLFYCTYTIHFLWTVCNTKAHEVSCVVITLWKSPSKSCIVSLSLQSCSFREFDAWRVVDNIIQNTHTCKSTNRCWLLRKKTSL